MSFFNSPIQPGPPFKVSVRNEAFMGVHTCSSILLVLYVRTKNENDAFSPDSLSVHTVIFDVHTYGGIFNS